ncbi:MAG: efflux RND transporter permease subunit [Melioribacteraceae bacterium]|nr:efflux RND transporter permease subunit [Melioribacteraceae bacterium]
MSLAKISIDRPIMMTMAILVFIIFGAIAYFTLNLNQMPDVEIPYVTINTIYPGAGPKEVETLITKKIEDAVSTVSQIERVESYSLDGVSIVIMEFNLAKGVDVANQEVKDKVDEILNDLPTDAKKPIVQKVDIRGFPILELALSGDQDPRELYEIADKLLKDRFSQVPGVAKVNITGGQEREVRVVLNNKEVYENFISLPQLLSILQMHNMNLPGGYFQINDQEFTVRLEGEFHSLQSIRDLLIPTPFGNKKLSQLAKVEDSGKDIRQRAVYYNVKENVRNENVVRLGLIKSQEGNAVEVANEIRSRLPEIKQLLPPGANLEVVTDHTTYIRSTVDDTMGNIILGVIFTAIVLLIFLTHLRSTLIVAITMPAAIISTFLFFQLTNLTLNMMTLMGISVTIGVLVANSVVVLENIFRHKALGKNNKDAALIGTNEVTVAVLASTMTNLVVFLPIATMSSMVGMFLRELALAATFATLFSLVFSFTLTPMLASLMLGKKEKEGKIAKQLNKIYDSWDEKYKSLLTVLLKNKMRAILIVVGSFLLFFIVMATLGPNIGFEFSPASDDGIIKVEVELPEGYNLTETADVLKGIENKIKVHPEVKQMLTTLGKISDLNTGTNMARMDVELSDANERDISLNEMTSQFIKDLSAVPNASITVATGSEMGEGGSPIQLFLQGQDISKLEELKVVIIDKLKDVPGLINFDNSSRAGKPEITIKPKREVLADVGLTEQEIAYTMRASVEGLESSKYRESGNEYDITVTMNDDAVDTPEKIGNIPVVSSKGVVYRLAQLADINYTRGFTKILHRDKFTSIQFTGASAPGVPLGNVTSEIDARLKSVELPAGYRLSWGGNTKMMNDMVNDMAFAFFLAMILTYMLLAALLESFSQPIYILMTMPLAMIGVVSILFMTNIAFGITSLMGIIMLVGIVVNNAILMLDYANQLVRENEMPMKEALIEACPTKLKPILMSTLALILGMLPMAIGIGSSGKEMRMALGVVSVGGLIVSTILTLIVIPSMVYLFTRKKKDKKEVLVS